MFPVHNRVAQEEITALSLEALRLIELGPGATQSEWDDFRERKIDILDRIALDPGPFVYEEEAAELRELARHEAAALRLGLPSTWGDSSCL